ncbi:MaoC family dehydratase [Paraburkholderia sp. 32]|uniref:MaoC family dehydratase n=1 Tax=unclassified Paraburkholderia TaxID=2615204 RepID=UPI003D1C0DDB
MKTDLYFEDVVIDEVMTSPARTITPDDIAAFCALTEDFHPLHTDAEYAKSRGFSGLIAHGLYGLALMEGLKTSMKLYENTSIASLGWDAVRFRQPVLAGDTVRVSFNVIDKRLSSKPGRGVLTEAVRLLNQCDEVVIDARHAALVLSRDA